MFHTSVDSKTTITFSTLAIAAVALLFASGPILGNQQALAANLCGSGLCDPISGISYPSPLSHFFGGDVLHHGGFHHFHGGFHHHRVHSEEYSYIMVGLLLVFGFGRTLTCGASRHSNKRLHKPYDVQHSICNYEWPCRTLAPCHQYTIPATCT
jgi:hypothetical protein